MSAATDWLDGRAAGTLTTAEIDRYLEHWRDRFQVGVRISVAQ